MSFAPLLNASLAIQLHAFSAMAAFAVGLLQFAGPFGPIHLLSIFVLLMAPLALYWVRGRRNVRGHALTVIGMFVGGLIIAGAFTFIPGRLMHAVAFGN